MLLLGLFVDPIFLLVRLVVRLPVVCVPACVVAITRPVAAALRPIASAWKLRAQPACARRSMFCRSHSRLQLRQMFWLCGADDQKFDISMAYLARGSRCEANWQCVELCRRSRRGEVGRTCRMLDRDILVCRQDALFCSDHATKIELGCALWCCVCFKGRNWKVRLSGVC